MHRLVIVSGPNRGSSFALVEGENSIGRQMDNHIVLSSGKVSKRHCAVLVTSNDVYLRDEGSTNGTFVNGTLVRKLPLKPGDKLGVGEFVMELVGGSTVPAVAHSQTPALVSLPTSAASPTAAPVYTAEMPEDLPGKLKFNFENKLMPFFYGTLMKSEYRGIVATLLSILVVISVVGALMPMVDLAEKSIQREGMLRAKVLAREIADRYTPAIASRSESQVDLSFIESEESVKLVMITDPNLQIIAPQARLNQVFARGREAAFAMVAAKEFKEGRERGIGTMVNDATAVFIEPIRIVDARQVKPVIGALVIVGIDISENVLAAGGLGVAFGTGFVIAGILGVLVYFIFMRLTMKPFEVLNDDLDQVLRGELPKVTHEFKIEELTTLWNNINAAIQRIPKNTGQDFNSGMENIVNWDQELSGIRALCESAQQGFIAFDSKLNVVAMNPQFEEVSGIRVDGVGQTLQQVARDQAFVALVKDVNERVGSSPSRSALDDFEFSGVRYQVVAIGVGPVSDSGFAMVFKKRE